MPGTSNNRGSSRRAGYWDVRQRGFDGRVSVEEAIEWVDSHTPCLRIEEIPVEQSAGRVLQTAWQAPAEAPTNDCVSADGYAIRSEETVGAGNYNPLLFSIQEGITPLLPASVARVAAGDALPPGADAVLPFEAVQANQGTLEVSSAIVPGAGIARKGEQVRAGNELLPASQPLRPQDLGLAASFGLTALPVVRQPRVRLVIAGAKPCAFSRPGDANGPMLRALIARDGGVMETLCSGRSDRQAIAHAITGASADVILVAGRTGTGADDEAPLALAAAGEVAIHGIALRPGGTVGMGTAGSTPVFLLPGDPLACLCAYDLFAGRMIRRLGGRRPGLPYVAREFELVRKLVSTIGVVELCRVRLAQGKAEPLGSAEAGGLASAVRADGFVVVPAASEGYPPGARVEVYLYRELQT
jgi:molybdopterin molybdotransferase